MYTTSCDVIDSDALFYFSNLLWVHDAVLPLVNAVRYGMYILTACIFHDSARAGSALTRARGTDPEGYEIMRKQAAWYRRCGERHPGGRNGTLDTRASNI